MNRLLATGGGGGAPLAGGGGPPRMPYFATRQSKVGFPIFSREDLTGWIMRCDHFFTVDLTPDESKVRLAVINFKGRALQWFQNCSKYRIKLSQLHGCYFCKLWKVSLAITFSEIR